MGKVAGVETGTEHVAQSPVQCALPGHGLGRKRSGSGQAADPDLLARRCRAFDHLGPGSHPRAEQAAPESRHLPPAGDRPEQSHHALAGAARRGFGFPGLAQDTSRQAVPDRRSDRRRSCDYPWRSHAGAGLVIRIPVRWIVARQQDRTGEMYGQRSASAGQCRDRSGRRDPSR